jgi:hypothetical protein
VVAFQLILGYEPNDAERRACLEALAVWKRELPAAQAGAETRARMDLIRALINHNDFITIR